MMVNFMQPMVMMHIKTMILMSLIMIMIVAMFGLQRATKAATTRIMITTREAQMARTGTTRTTKIRIIRTAKSLQR